MFSQSHYTANGPVMYAKLLLFLRSSVGQMPVVNSGRIQLFKYDHLVRCRLCRPKSIYFLQVAFLIFSCLTLSVIYIFQNQLTLTLSSPVSREGREGKSILTPIVLITAEAAAETWLILFHISTPLFTVRFIVTFFLASLQDAV